MKIKIVKMRSEAIIPQYQTALAAGFDLHAATSDDIVIKPGKFVAIPIGLAMEIPAGYELQIRPRSGLAYKNGVTMLNGVGTIDADYRGEMQVLLINHSGKDFVVTPGMRIAQGVITKHETAEWVEVGALSETERGAGGFGSTGE